MSQRDGKPQRTHGRLRSAGLIALLLVAGSGILYTVLQLGQVTPGLYWGLGAVCLLAAAGEVISRTRFQRSLLGFEFAWPVLVLALVATGVGLLLLGLAWTPVLAKFSLAIGLGTYLVWSVMEIRARGRNPLAEGGVR